jgi:elongation factor Ts
MAVKVSAAQVKELRDLTGAGPLDCKKALEDNDGDVQKAAAALREKAKERGIKISGKSRTMNEGVIEIYQHFTGRLGVMVEVNCETDFVAKTDKFKTFAKDVALHISSEQPKYVKREDVPQAVLDAETADLMRMEDLAGKPDNIKEKIVAGRLDKWYKEFVLMEQQFIKDDTKTVQQVLEEVISSVGEKMQISRFARFEVGGYAGNAEGGDEE